jgi:coenzyme Q-binding protein COQ10
LPVFETRRRISVPADVAYEVAADVGAYKLFLPLMQKSTVIGTKQKTSNGEAFEAELAVAYPKIGLSGQFISRVETDTSHRTVRAKSTDGPFRFVETIWRITPASSGSDISIRIDYAFRNPLMQLAAAGVMDVAISKVISAFEARAVSLLAERNALKQV